MKKKLTSLVLTAAIGLFGYLSASAASGDIFSITRCDENGIDLTGPATTAAVPFGAGKELYFKVRLQARNQISALAGKKWHMEYYGIGSEIVANALTPMQIGVYVSGRLDYATYVTDWAEGDTCTAVIFKYVTKPGDFARPIRLATATGPAGDVRSDSEYYFNPQRSFWGFAEDVISDDMSETNSVPCRWTFRTPDEIIPGESFASTKDYSLEKCGFYVKTIDFSDDWETTDFWRTIHENSTITGGGSVPKLVADAAPEVETTLYVWSENEDAVKIKGGTPVTMKVTTTGGTRTIQVGAVTFAGGQLSKDFLIEGVAENGTANIVLSAYDHFNYSLATGDRLDDYLTVPVKCIEPLPPSVIVDCDRATAIAGSDYTSYAAVLNVYLSQPYEEAVKVSITPQFTDGSGVDWKNYLRFSTTTDTIDEPMADGSDAAIPTVTIPANTTVKVPIYVFALRADTHTLGGAKVKFQSAIVDNPTADAAIEKGAKSINIAAETTSIFAPAEGSKAVSTTCNDEYPFTIAVEDTYADTHDTATGYQIYVKYRSSDTYVKLDGSYYVGDSGALYLLDPLDPIDPKTTKLPILKYTASGENIESQVYVVAPVNPNTGSAKKSEVRTFLADVKEARTATLTYWDETFTAEKRTFQEGESAAIKIKLSEKYEDASRVMYAYLKPSSSASADMFSSGPYNFIIGADEPEGIPVENTDEVDGSITFRDGLKAPGLTVAFEVMFSYDQHWDGTDEENKRIKGYASTKPTVKVYNVEPTIKKIEMNGMKASGDGYNYPNKLPRDQEQTFTLTANDPGTYDLTNTNKPFKVRWTATLDGTPYDDPKVLEGYPEEHPFKYSFPAAGVWQVTAEVRDKDMDDWSDVTYTVYVTVLAQPAVEHGAQEISLIEKLGLNEESKRKFNVGVSYWDQK